MLCIHQNQSSSFKGPISHSSSSSSSSSFESNIDLLEQFNCDDDFRNINLADFSIDVPLDDSLDQMFNNQQQHQHNQQLSTFGLSSSGYSTPSSTPTNSPIPLSTQLNLHQTSSSRLSNNNNNNSISNNNEILDSNQLQLIESTETSLSSTPTTPSSATFIYSPRQFTQLAPQSLDQQHNQQQSITSMAPDDGSSLFKFEIGDLNDDDTSFSTVSFGSLSKSGQNSGPLIDLSFVKQEVDHDDDLNSIPLQIETIDQHLQHHPIRSQQPYNQSPRPQEMTTFTNSSVTSSPGYMSTNLELRRSQQQQQQQQLINHHHLSHSHHHHHHHHQPNVQSQLRQQQLISQSQQYDCVNTSAASINFSYKSNIDQRTSPSSTSENQYHQLHHQIHQQSPQMSPMTQSIRPSIAPSSNNIIQSSTNQQQQSTSSAEHLTNRDSGYLLRSSLASLISPGNLHESSSSLLTSSDRSSPPTELSQIHECSSKVPLNHGIVSNFDTPSTFTLKKAIVSSPPPPSSLAGETSSNATGQQPAHQLCAVCGDNAACQHYGVRTCEGCKGFFKRTVQKGSKYVCLGNKDCPVDKRRRNRCQFCRFQKCLAVGMVKEVVRTDDLKGRRGRLPSRLKSSSQEAPPSPPVSLITAMVRAHVDTCTEISNLDHSQYREISESESFNCNPMSRQQFINLLMSSMDTMKTFADKVPGFSDLDKHDQELLYYSSCLEMISLRIAYQNKPGSKQIILPNGVVLHRNQIKLLFGFWFDNLELFSSRFAQIDIDISAFACLLGLSLITARHGLVNPDRVDNLQMKIIESLRDHVTYNAEAQKKSQYFSSILSKLPDLRSISMDGLTYLHDIKSESLVPIPESISRLLNNNALY